MRSALRSSLVALAILGGWTSVASADPLLTVSFKSTPVGALYAPANVVAVWIEDANGDFVKTIGRWANVRREHLVAWRAMAGINDVDAVSGATRLDHQDTLTVTWDLVNKLGEVVPDGVYTLRMEMADGNSTATAQNWQGTFTFTKSLAPDVQTIAVDPAIGTPKWTEISIKYDPTANECNNGVVDTGIGETCDPPGSCPTACDQSVGEACAPNVLVGSSLACSAACAIVPITACIHGDGCCADGCSPFEDDDCESRQTVAGGCATSDRDGRGALLAFGLLGLITFASRRRR